MHAAQKTKRYAPPRRFSRCASSARRRRRCWPPVAAANELKMPIHAKWHGKRHAARRDETPYLRMMHNSSHYERKYYSKINALRGCYAVVFSDVCLGDGVQRTW